MVLTMTEVELDIHTKQDGAWARKPDFAVSRSEKSALVNNQAAEHALRTALRSINQMQNQAKQQHHQQVQQFLESISDDVFMENMTSSEAVARRRLQQRRNSRSLDDVTLLGESQDGKFLFKRLETLDLSKSSSQEELPDIKKRSSVGSTNKSLLSPGEPESPRRPGAQGMVKRLSQLSSSTDASSCPNSPLTRRRKKVEKIDVSQIPVTTSTRPRASSFNSPTSASVTSPNGSSELSPNSASVLSPTSSVDGRFRASSFTGSTSGTSGNFTPRRLRAQVERNIQSELESARREAVRRKRILARKDRGESWENQIARDQIERSDRPSSDSDEEVVTSPYSISSSMRISHTAGTFEKKTGKGGLKAWMGRPKVKK